ncbi:hypothetical protein V8C86DRAFT_2893104 [Haematococcus lacustris]
MHCPAPLHLIMHALHISLGHAAYNCLPSIVQHQVAPKHDVSTLPVAGTSVLCMAWYVEMLVSPICQHNSPTHFPHQLWMD